MPKARSKFLILASSGSPDSWLRRTSRTTAHLELVPPTPSSGHAECGPSAEGLSPCSEWQTV
jgi:hypothetical protein